MAIKNEILVQLAAPFHPSRITWKPQAMTKDKAKAMAVAYADPRAYMDRLDGVCSLDWSVTFTPWGERIICHLTIGGITRSSTGESDSQSERSEIAGTAAEMQAFKRACAMFGLGRYLYSLPSTWVEYDTNGQGFTEKAKTRLHGIIAQHYQRHLDGQPAGEDDPIVDGDDGETTPASELDKLGGELYGEQWPNVRAHNIKRLTGDEKASLTQAQANQLIAGLCKLRQQRQTA